MSESKISYNRSKKKYNINNYNELIDEYSDIIKKIEILDKFMRDENVEMSTKLAIELFNRNYNYQRLKKFFFILKILYKKNPNSNELEKLYIKVENFIFNCQTGDVIPLNITTNTNYGNLIQKILEQKSIYGKRKTQKKRKSHKKKEKHKKK